MRFNATAQTQGGEAGGQAALREETVDGTRYLVAPVVAQQEGVYSYTDQSGIRHEFVPASELRENTDAWEDTPLVLRHPTNAEGEYVHMEDAPDPAVVGRYQNVVPTEDGTGLGGEVWINTDEIGEHGGDLRGYVNDLRDGQFGEVSTGYTAGRIDIEQGTYNGQSYEYVQRDLSPDHLALLPDERGNCSVGEGCGVGRANDDGVPSDGADDSFRAMALGPRPDGAEFDAETMNSWYARLGRRVASLFNRGEIDGSEDVDVGMGLTLTANDGTVSVTDEESASDEPAESGMEGDSGNDDSITMEDEQKIDELVEDHGLTRDNMEALAGTECLDNIYERFTANEESTSDSDSEADSGDDAADGLAKEDVVEIVNEQVSDAVADAVEEQADKFADTVETARENKAHVETVAESDVFDFDRDRLHEMDADAVEAMAEKVEAEAEESRENDSGGSPRGNFSAMPTGKSVDISANDGVESEIPVAGQRDTSDGDE